LKYFFCIFDSLKAYSTIHSIYKDMLHINKEKLLETREKLLNLLSSKELNDDVQRLVREDLRNLEKELEELGESKKDPQDKG